jgi:hypothetical protein
MDDRQAEIRAQHQQMLQQAQQQQQSQQRQLQLQKQVNVATAMPHTWDEWNEFRWRKAIAQNPPEQRLSPDEYAGYTLSMWQSATATPGQDAREEDAKLTDFYCRRVMQAFGGCFKTSTGKSKNVRFF